MIVILLLSSVLVLYMMLSGDLLCLINVSVKCMLLVCVRCDFSLGYIFVCCSVCLVYMFAGIVFICVIVK